jgi:hypothetical protein
MKILDGNNYWNWKIVEKYNEGNPLRNKPLQRILDEMKYEMT